MDPLSEIMASALVERGIWTPEQVAQERATADAGAQADQPPASAAPSTAPAAPIPLFEEGPDDLSPLDAAFFAGPASPAAYHFQSPPPGAEVSFEQEAAVRQMLHAAEIPPEIGNAIGTKWNEACAAGPVTDVHLERTFQEANVALNKLWGPGAFQQNMAIANKELDRIAAVNPSIPVKAMLKQSGLANDVFVITSLVNMAKARGRG